MHANFRLPRIRLSSLGLSWPLLVAVAVCVRFLVGSTTQMLSDPDTHLHLASGHWILQHLSVPDVDPFSYTMAGQPWIAHEWLAQCLLAVFYDWGGWTGLVLLTVSCYALTLAYLLRYLLARMPPIYALFFTTLAYVALRTHLLARPHVLSWLLLAVWAGTLIKSSERNLSPPWWLLGLMLLWANLHGSFTLGLALLPAIGLEALLNSPRASRWQTLKSWSFFFVLAVLAAMITPSGWKGLWFTFQVLDLKSLNGIVEWMPPGSSTLLMLEFTLAVLLGLACTGYLRLPVIRLLLVLGLLHQALTHVRYISLFGLLTPLLIASPFGELYAARTAGQQQATSLDDIFTRLAAPARRSTIAVAVVVVVLTGFITGQTGRHVPAAANTPQAAVDAALRAGAAGHVLNADNFGGYLMSRGIPVFIDGRADLYGDRHMDAYTALGSNQAEKIQKVLDDFNIAWTLLPPGAGTLLYLNMRADWRKVYEDETAVVHIRHPSS